MDFRSLEQANAAMLHNTNRAILLTTVNPDQEAPCLSRLLEDLRDGLASGQSSWDVYFQMQKEVERRLIVSSFREFLEKFRPCCHYRSESSSASETGLWDLLDEQDLRSMMENLPQYRFSLSGGGGWKKMPVMEDNFYLRCLLRRMTDPKPATPLDPRGSILELNTDLFGYQPRNSYRACLINAEHAFASAKKLCLEYNRDPNSPELRKATEDYHSRMNRFGEVVSDELGILGAIVYGLDALTKTLPQNGHKTAGPEIFAEGMRNLGPLLEIVRKQSTHDRVDVTPLEIMSLPGPQQYPAFIGQFLYKMVSLKRLSPCLGILAAFVLFPPKEIAAWKIPPETLRLIHTLCLGIYGQAHQNFIHETAPLFETLLGIYSLFQEVPEDVRDFRTKLIVANNELEDLQQVYKEELNNWFRFTCQQSLNQYRDALSFAIVPSVAPLVSANLSAPGPAIPARDLADFQPGTSIVEEPWQREEERRRREEELATVLRQRIQRKGVCGSVTGAGDLIELMKLGDRCGFQVLFSPQERLIPGHTQSASIRKMQTDYTPAAVVNSDWADSGVLCTPEFVCLPNDDLSWSVDGDAGLVIPVGLQEILVRGCYVAAGILMANDEPRNLQVQLFRAPQTKSAASHLRVNSALPGIGLDLTLYPMFASTRLSAQSFLADAAPQRFLSNGQSFLVFAGTAGKSTGIVAARTLRRVSMPNGGFGYRPIHHFRQEVYLQRLFPAAHKLAGGMAPNLNEMRDLLGNLLHGSHWYQGYVPNHTEIVNAIPGPLENNTIHVIRANAGYSVSWTFISHPVSNIQVTFQ